MIEYTKVGVIKYRL